MQLFVRSDTGRTVVVAVESCATIAAVASLFDENDRHQKKQAHGMKMAQLLLSENDRYLAYGGVPLRAERTLADYGIQNHATLECCLRKRGGCFIVSITLWIIIFLCFLLSLCTCGLSLPVALVLIPFALLLPLCCL